MNPSDQPKVRYLEDGTRVEFGPNPNPDAPVTKISVQERRLENVAKGYWLGHTARNRNQELKQQMEKAVVSRIGKKGKLLTDKLFELIQGVYIVTDEKINPDTGKPEVIRYYREKPDLKAIMYAIDRVLGKPTERTETFDENDGIKSMASILKSLATIKKKEDAQEPVRADVIEVK